MPYPIDRALALHNARQKQAEHMRNIEEQRLPEARPSKKPNIPDSTPVDAASYDSMSIESDQTQIYNPEERRWLRIPEQKEREISYALASTHRNLTRMSQYILKLEARAKAVSNIHVRKTVDAIIEDNYYTSKDDTEPGHTQFIEDIKSLSNDTWNRLLSLDREFRRMSRENRDAAGNSMPFQLHGESYVKRWVQGEIDNNSLRGEETCFYTVEDMASGRGFRDWMKYLKETYQFDCTPAGEFRLAQMAWHLLDRAIRPAKPDNPTSMNDFIRDWESLRSSGAFQEAVDDPGRQNREDEDALKTIQKVWSARTCL
ncbi:hypothetical protein BJ170DRAFT_692361 [Xylariales sp. AK1849]|nr:hypothetical protein BJ170DRAFT_692361 [Xylariales sp. AK1849]